MQNIANYQNAFVDYLEEFTKEENQKFIRAYQLYFKLGGKRLRPVLTLMTADIFNAIIKKP